MCGQLSLDLFECGSFTSGPRQKKAPALSLRVADSVLLPVDAPTIVQICRGLSLEVQHCGASWNSTYCKPADHESTKVRRCMYSDHLCAYPRQPFADHWLRQSEIYIEKGIASIRLNGDHPRNTEAKFEETNPHI